MRIDNTPETTISNSDLMNDDVKKSLESILSSTLFDKIGFDAELDNHISCQNVHFVFQSCRRILTIYLPEGKPLTIKEICARAIETYYTDKQSPYLDPDSLRYKTNIKK